MEDNCYLCGSTENLTRDHIPPKGFFPPNKRYNLVTVSCCGDCHKVLSLDDEAFRIFTTAQINRSSEGAWIWKNKVMGSSFKRSPKLKENVKKSLIRTNLTDAQGLQHSAITIPVERAEKFLIRLTKGLIVHHRPEINPINKKYKVTMLKPTQDLIDNTLNKFRYAEIGDGVFRYWRAYNNDEEFIYVWVYVFYDGAMFMVEVS
ncbi:hypothetical protein GF360_01590 [candidate division WWE3 bacterium]|nr:hypothetical protein [candidate division WWE3 bacterium]